MSQDGSVETIEKYKKKDNRVHLIKNKRKRYNGGSRNVGIEYALDNIDFDYFCFLDSDDWYKNNKVLEDINNRLYNHDMLLIGAEMLFKDGVKYKTFNEYKTYEEFFISEGKSTLWCVAWCRVIKKDKIVYFCEDTLMEDRVWSYRQADNVDINKVTNLKKICYVWNRTNVNNSVSIVRSDYWNASAYCHIGHQLQLLTQLKHKEMIPVLQERIKTCRNNINKGIYQQY
jgi:glycosyltransferase involved in cell wall biosynthesis